MKGPAVFLAQFMRDEKPYNNIHNIGRWVANLGFKGVQIPGWDPRVIDLNKAAESKTCCDEYKDRPCSQSEDPGFEVTGYLLEPGMEGN